MTKKMIKLVLIGLVALLVSGCTKSNFERLMYGGVIDDSKTLAISRGVETEDTDDVSSAPTKKTDILASTDTLSSATKSIDGTPLSGSDTTTSATRNPSAILATVSYDTVVDGIFGGVEGGVLRIDIPTQSTLDTVTSATKTSSLTTTELKQVSYPLSVTVVLSDEDGTTLDLSNFRIGDRITIYISLGQVVAIELNDEGPAEITPDKDEDEDEEEDEDEADDDEEDEIDEDEDEEEDEDEDDDEDEKDEVED